MDFGSIKQLAKVINNEVYFIIFRAQMKKMMILPKIIRKDQY